MTKYTSDGQLIEHQHESSFADEYIAAQRAAFESIQIGRETAATLQEQGEQLQRSESIADETQYKLDRATRLLKGMTWSGWVNNMFTSIPQVPSASFQSCSSAEKSTSPITSLSHGGAIDCDLNKYDSVPKSCQTVVQAMKNYLANVTILKSCETEEQKNTCKQVCDLMYSDARQLINHNKIQKSADKSKQNDTLSVEGYMIEMERDLEIIRKQQIVYQSQVIALPNGFRPDKVTTNNSGINAQNEREELFGRNSLNINKDGHLSHREVVKSSPVKSIEEQKQDDHLNILASSLNELGNIAHSLNSGLQEQKKAIDSLENKSDQVYETSKMVTRRANRLIQDKSWTQASSMKQSIFYATFSIRHVESGKYLAVMGTDLYLVNRFNNLSCSFDVYKRHGNVIGIKSHANHKWVGQSFLTGSITCSSSTFGKREEWETENSSTWTNPINSANSSSTTVTVNTRLLCVSAGWGQGGYVQIMKNEDYAIRIGSISTEDSKNAARWTITLANGGTDSR